MVKRFWAALLAILVMGADVACKRSIDNQEAVRQAVIDYLSKRSNLNVSAMNVDVASVTFRPNEADAVVAITVRGATPGQPMSMRYTLERQGDHWAVKSKADAGGSPHGAGAANPHGVAEPPAAGELPPGHPAVPSTPKQ
jgi:hypothetical protein